MKKTFILSMLLVSSAWSWAESVPTTEEFRTIMKREYRINVPEVLTAGTRSAEICYGIDNLACNKLFAMCEESQSEGCKAHLATLEKLVNKEYDKR